MDSDGHYPEPEPYTLEFMLAHRRLFLAAISAQFPLSCAAIERHAQILDWYLLTWNSALDWSLELLEAHRTRWWNDLLGPSFLRFAHQRRSVEPLELYRAFETGTHEWTDRHIATLREGITLPPVARPPTLDWTPDMIDDRLAADAGAGRSAVNWDELCRLGGPRLWTPAFIEQHEQSLDREVLRNNPALTARLVPATIEAFLTACHVDPDEPRHRELERIIAANPDSPAGYDVYADWLDERHRDPHATLIRLMRGVEHGQVESEVAARAAASYVAQFGVERELVWRCGFVRKAAWFRREDGSDWRELLTRRSFALVEELRICDGVHAGLGNFFRGTMGTDEWAVLARLPALSKLALHHVELSPSPNGPELHQLTHLDLSSSMLLDLSVLERLPNLRSLTFCDGFYLRCSFEGLARLSALREIALVCYEDPHPGLLDLLARCKGLHTLMIRNPEEYDLSSFARIPQLRRLIVSPSGLTDTEQQLAALLRERPELEIQHDGAQPWFIPIDSNPDFDQWAWPPTFFYDW
jgi:uncharacterized protein (TIGR02996 family)